MENILKNEYGIMQAKVDFKKGTVHIAYDESKISQQEVYEETARLGIPIEIISQS